MTTIIPTSMSDRDLLDATVRAARSERDVTVELLKLLGELDDRKLYLGEGCSSLFTYCTQVLHLSEHAAYHRIEVARAARRFPVILDMVGDGALTLTTAAILRRHLTQENHETLLTAARYKTKLEVEHQVAGLAPKPDAKTLIRRIPDAIKSNVSDLLSLRGPVEATSAPPQATMAPTLARPSAAQTIVPLATDRYLLRVTLSAEAHTNLRRAQDLMRHTIPTGDAATVLARALEVLVERLEKMKAAKSRRPRLAASPLSNAATLDRHIPARVRRAVWSRDEGRCAFAGPQGRCTETGHLEFHHVLPFARGGPASVSNIALRCRAHNRFESEAIFGRWEKPASNSVRPAPTSNVDFSHRVKCGALLGRYPRS